MYFLLNVMFIFLLSGLLSGCLSNYKVLSLYPNEYDVEKKTTEKHNIAKHTTGTVYFEKITAFESVKSANIPMLLEDGKLFTDQNFIWLRSPAMLIDEYIKMRWKDMGGKLFAEKSKNNTVQLSLQQCYIDKKTSLFYIELRVEINNKMKLIEKKSDVKLIVKTTLDSIEDVVDFIRKNQI